MTTLQAPLPATSRVSVAIALGLVYVVWGSTYLAIRYAVETLPPFWMAAVRFLLAGSILYGLSRLRGAARPTRSQWRAAGVVGVLLLTGGNGCVVWAEQSIDSSLAALLASSSSFWMVVLDWRLNGRRPTGGVVTGLVAGVGGVALLVGPEALRAEASLAPSLVILMGCLFWSLGSVVGKRADRPASSLLGSGMEMIAGGAGLLILGLITGEAGQLDAGSISASSVAGLGYLLVFGSLVGFSAYSWLLRNAPLPLVSTYAYVNPVVAVALGWAIAGEQVSIRTGIAAGLIVLSVAAITALQRPRRP